MDTHAAIEQLRTLIITQDLPRTDMALFGIRCPYCGKSDRIRELDAPEKSLGDVLAPDLFDAYVDLWRRLNPLSAALAVCKFCQNPLRLSPDASGSEVLDAPEVTQTAISPEGGDIMIIEVLGPGCARCDQLYKNAVEAVSRIDSTESIKIMKIKDIHIFAEMGVFMTPGLVIDGDVASTGKVLSPEEIGDIIKEKR